MPLQSIFPAIGWPLVAAGIGVALAAIGAWLLLPELRRYRRAPIDVQQARDLDGELATFRGTAVADESTLEAPFTAIDCLAYSWEVDEPAKGKNAGWRTIASGERSTPFRVKDHTGSILVDPDDHDVHFTDEWRTVVGPSETVKGHAREFLESVEGIDPGSAKERSLAGVSIGYGDKRRYTERRLEPQETVVADGPVVRDPDADRSWGSDAPIATMRSTEAGDLAIADARELPLLRSEIYLPAAVVLAGVALVGWAVLSVAGVL